MSKFINRSEVRSRFQPKEKGKIDENAERVYRIRLDYRLGYCPIRCKSTIRVSKQKKKTIQFRRRLIGELVRNGKLGDSMLWKRELGDERIEEVF